MIPESLDKELDPVDKNVSAAPPFVDVVVGAANVEDPAESNE